MDTATGPSDGALISFSTACALEADMREETKAGLAYAGEIRTPAARSAASSTLASATPTINDPSNAKTATAVPYERSKKSSFHTYGVS
jgi:hypothetical protein